jgi:hypothetical protein
MVKESLLLEIALNHCLITGGKQRYIKALLPITPSKFNGE